MRGLAWGVVGAIVSGWAGPAPGAPEAPVVPMAAPLSPAESTLTAIWDVDAASPDSRVVHLSFVAAACSAVKRIVVEETVDRVVITLDQQGRNGKDCTEPFLRHRTVRLAAPLGHRALYDGGIAPPQLVRAAG